MPPPLDVRELLSAACFDSARLRPGSAGAVGRQIGALGLSHRDAMTSTARLITCSDSLMQLG